MSSDAAAAAAASWPRDIGGTDRHRPPPEIRVDDEDGAAKLVSPDAVRDASWTGDQERRRSMPAGHGRFVDEPYVFSLSQALALSGRRRSEPFMDASGETRGTSPCGGASPRRHLFVDQLAASSGGKHAAAAETWKVTADERRSSVGAIPKTTTTTTTTPLASLDELSRLPPVARPLSGSSSPSQDSDDEQLTPVSGSRFLSLPPTADCLAIPARRHSVALIQPSTSRILDVIAEETVSTDSKTLASSRRYSLSCHLNS